MKRLRHNQISLCADAFEDDFWGHLCSIGSNGKNDGEAPQDFTDTVQLPLNSSVWFEGSSKCMGVSSML